MPTVWNIWPPIVCITILSLLFAVHISSVAFGASCLSLVFSLLFRFLFFVFFFFLLFFFFFFSSFFFFFFQAEDGIRDTSVTGVQTCALPIWLMSSRQWASRLQFNTGRNCSIARSAKSSYPRRHSTSPRYSEPARLH